MPTRPYVADRIPPAGDRLARPAGLHTLVLTASALSLVLKGQTLLQVGQDPWPGAGILLATLTGPALVM